MIRIGMIIGDRYEIQEKIGTGGMSDVYRALDHKLNRPVAVKVLKAEFSENQNFVQKFRSEAQAAAGLMHPNIVNVYDVGNDKGVYYFVMELVDGITLKKYIEKKQRLTVKEAVSIGIQVAMGLDAAHKNEIIHRDIKPQNIMISKDGKVKVTDFGIAKAASSNTITSNVMGSVHYTSPEQARGGYSDAKSDIYSLGVTLFEMVTGRVPYNGDTTVAIAIKHIQEPFPSPREFAPDLPVSVEKIILKCCQKSPDRRYHSAEELIKDLKRSLISPDEDFVELVSPDEDGMTRIATDTEQEMIRHNDVTGKTGEMRLKDDVQNSQPSRNADSRPSQNQQSQRSRAVDSRNTTSFEDGYELDRTMRQQPAKASVKRRSASQGLVRPDNDESLDRVMIIMAIVAVVLVGVILILVIGGNIGLFNDSGSGSSGSVAVSAAADDNGSGIIVPNVVGSSFAEAKITLTGKGFNVERADDTSNTEPINTVTGQSVAADSRAEAGTTITIYVSNGSGVASTGASEGASGELVKMPDLTGMDEAAARLELIRMGFSDDNVKSVEVSNSNGASAGQVIKQTPVADSDVSTSDQVSLEISKGPEYYVYTGTVSAPTAAESPQYVAGVPVEVTVTAKDGTLLYRQSITNFPVNVAQNQNQNYTTSTTGTMTLTFTVTDESGASSAHTVTRSVNLSGMQ